jgi:hypothetical protein
LPAANSWLASRRRNGMRARSASGRKRRERVRCRCGQKTGRLRRRARGRTAIAHRLSSWWGRHRARLSDCQLGAPVPSRVRDGRSPRFHNDQTYWRLCEAVRTVCRQLAAPTRSVRVGRLCGYGGYRGDTAKSVYFRPDVLATVRSCAHHLRHSSSSGRTQPTICLPLSINSSVIYGDETRALL